jgi:hypothetical protein
MYPAKLIKDVSYSLPLIRAGLGWGKPKLIKYKTAINLAPCP